MDIKKIILSFLAISLIGFAIGFYLVKVYNCGNSIFCYDLTTRAFAAYYGMPALAFIFIILLFFQNSVSAWKKFAKWFIPPAVLLFIFYSEPGSGNYFSPYPEQVFQWVSGLYVVVSLLIIGKTVFLKKSQD